MRKIVLLIFILAFVNVMFANIYTGTFNGNVNGSATTAGNLTTINTNNINTNNASQLSSGTVPTAQLPSNLQKWNGLDTNKPNINIAGNANTVTGSVAIANSVVTKSLSIDSGIGMITPDSMTLYALSAKGSYNLIVISGGSSFVFTNVPNDISDPNQFSFLEFYSDLSGLSCDYSGADVWSSIDGGSTLKSVGGVLTINVATNFLHATNIRLVGWDDVGGNSHTFTGLGLPGFYTWSANGATLTNNSYTYITNSIRLNGVSGVTLPTNSPSSWPAAPMTPGGAAEVNSNGTIYMLTSGPNGTAWTATNKIAP